MITVLTGANSSALRQKVADLKKAFTEQYSASGIEQFDGEALQVQDVTGLLQGATLFSTQRLIVIKNVSTQKEVAAEFAVRFSSIADTVDIVFIEPTLDKRTVFYKELKKVADIMTFDKMNDISAQRWATDYAKKNNGTISLQDAQFLVQRVGPNQIRLENELDKLLLSTKTITRSIIEDVVEADSRETIFELLESALSGQLQKALHVLHQLEASKSDAHQIFGMLVWQVNIVAIVHSAKQLPDSTVAKQAKINPYVVSKSRRLASRLDKKELSRIITTVADAERQLKQTGVKPFQVLEFVINSMAR